MYTILNLGLFITYALSWARYGREWDRRARGADAYWAAFQERFDRYLATQRQGA